jgi:hypothetical protein
MRRRILLVVTLVAGALLAVGLVLVLRGGGTKVRTSTVLAVHREVDVSRLRGPQSETAIAVDPRNAQVLLAGSNDLGSEAMAVYGSTDGGRRWTRGLLGSGSGFCETSDPSVAIDARGRQLYSFIGLRCTGRRIVSAYVYVATRSGPSGRWRIHGPVAPQGLLGEGDDHPMLVVDTEPHSPHRGRIYVGWTRFAVNPDAFVNPEEQDVDLVDASARLSYSDDGGRHWSKAAVIARGGRPLEVRLAVGPTGAVYVVWRDSTTDVVYLRRSDDGSTFRPRAFVAAGGVPVGSACRRAATRIPAQPRRCVLPNPFVSVDTSRGPFRGRVYVSYGSTSLFRSQDVYLAAFDPDLHRLFGVGTPNRVDPPSGFSGPDAFLPVSSVDAKSGHVWVCYYLTGRKKARKRARYACRMSEDGGVSWTPQRIVARVPSDETVKRANRGNGYGDYEGVVALGRVAHPIWTDGRDLRRHGEEVYSATLTERVVRVK